jgi:SAM-dependent methyltransferase
MEVPVGSANSMQAMPIGADTYSTAMSEADNYINWILAVLRPYLKGPLLEIGIGHGSYATVLRDFGDYTGCDLDRTSVEEARKRFPDLEFEAADITSTDFCRRFSRRFASVVCSNVIEHISADDVAVQNLAESLAPQGHLLIVVPAFEWLTNDLDRLAGHLRRYRVKDIERLFRLADLEPVKIDYFNPIGGLGWWANRMLPHNSLNDSAVNAQIRAFDRYVVPLSRMIDPLTKRFFGQSIIAVGKRP